MASFETLLHQLQFSNVQVYEEGEMEVIVQIFMQIDHCITATIKIWRTGLRLANSSN